MFAKFKIEKRTIDLNFPYTKNEEEWEMKEAHVKNQLKSLILGEDGVIDGNRLMEWCFPLNLGEEYPIFISHSHADVDTARSLAEYIKEQYGLNCFIDSLVWRNAFRVLNEIDKMYCWDDENSWYTYSKRNYTTAHVYAMLSLSLMEMIQKTECCILIGNGGTINLNNVREGHTISPWVYEEISYMNNLPIVPPRGLQVSDQVERKMFSDLEEIREAKEFKAQYSANITDFLTLDKSDFRSVIANSIDEKPQYKWLDCLYRKHGLIKTVLNE